MRSLRLAEGEGQAAKKGAKHRALRTAAKPLRSPEAREPVEGAGCIRRWFPLSLKGKNMGTVLDILILACILVLAVLAVRSLKKSGRRCNCGCSGCTMAGKCAKGTREEEKHG